MKYVLIFLCLSGVGFIVWAGLLGIEYLNVQNYIKAQQALIDSGKVPFGQFPKLKISVLQEQLPKLSTNITLIGSLGALCLIFFASFGRQFKLLGELTKQLEQTQPVNKTEAASHSLKITNANKGGGYSIGIKVDDTEERLVASNDTFLENLKNGKHKISFRFCKTKRQYKNGNGKVITVYWDFVKNSSVSLSFKHDRIGDAFKIVN